MTYVVPRQNDVPVTVGMLNSFRDELFARLDERFLRFDARFGEFKTEMKAELKNEIAGVKVEIADLKTEMAGMKTEMTYMNAEISNIMGMHHRTLFVIEDQKSQNMVALDAVRHALAELTDVRERVNVIETHLGI